MAGSSGSLVETLGGMTTKHADDLGLIPWASEADRWDELVFCIVNAFLRDPARARGASEMLSLLGLSGAETLARLAGEPDGSSADRAVVERILSRHGLADDDAAAAADVLVRAASTVQRRYDGLIQRYLRAKATEMRDELTDLLAADAPPPEELRAAVSHWLQNVASMPLSVCDGEIAGFLAEHEAGIEDLEAAADHLGLNVAVVDDVIRLETGAL